VNLHLPTHNDNEAIRDYQQERLDHPVLIEEGPGLVPNVPEEARIDEMAIAFKGRHRCKRYNPNKPDKWHLKSYCLNDSETGYHWNL